MIEVITPLLAAPPFSFDANPPPPAEAATGRAKFVQRVYRQKTRVTHLKPRFIDREQTPRP